MPHQGIANNAADTLVEVGARVLVVEDEAVLRLDICEQLLHCGYEVCEASGAEEASQLLLSGVQIDFVFTDVRMPGLADGIDLARWIKATRPGIPIIVTSGTPGVAARVGELCEGVDFIAKPYVAAGVVERIRSILCGAADPSS